MEQSSGSEPYGGAIGSLPTELLLLILKALPLPVRGAAAQVCHQWKDLVYDKTLWHPLRFSDAIWREKSDLNVAFTRLVDLLGADVEELDVSFCDANLEPATLQHALGRCVNLRSLSLAWCRQVTDEVLRAVTSNCKRLVHLDLRGCAQLTVDALMTLTNLPDLASLQLDYCLLPTPPSLVSLARACSSLRRLSTFYLRFLNQPGFRFNVWSDYAAHFPRNEQPPEPMDQEKKENGDDDGEKTSSEARLAFLPWEATRARVRSIGPVPGRVTLETDEWRRAYEESFDLTTPPQTQIAAAAARAGQEGKLVLLCVGLYNYIQVAEDWTIRLQNYMDHNPLLWAKLNEVFVWLHLDESTSRLDGQPMPTGNDSEYAALNEGVVEDWPRLIRSLPEWPYLFVLDASGRLLSRQPTGPLEKYDRYDHHTMFRFIENWRGFLETGQKPPIIKDGGGAQEPAYAALYGGGAFGWGPEGDEFVEVYSEEEVEEDGEEEEEGQEQQEEGQQEE